MLQNSRKKVAQTDTTEVSRNCVWPHAAQKKAAAGALPTVPTLAVCAVTETRI